MTATKVQYVCQQCGAASPKWVGQCPDCQAWNTLTEELVRKVSSHPPSLNYSGQKTSVTSLAEVDYQQCTRTPTGLTEFDRVLGGGLVAGSVVLIGGDPGIGKSTLLLQTLSYLSSKCCALYVSGEESLEQIRLRADRLSLKDLDVKLLAETAIETILGEAKRLKPQIMVVDSIQTLYSQAFTGAPGGIGQIRETATELVQFAKQTGTTVFLIGHVTKEGALAGPRLLEHMVDAVLYFEGAEDSRFRLIRAVKNRFGAVNELGVFAMTEKGLREITNPSAIFLSRTLPEASGSSVLVSWEGTRPLLVEVQALVDESYGSNPRRVTVGLEQNRLTMLLAVLHRHGKVHTHAQDVFVNVVGGIRVSETAADLCMLAAIVSSLKNKPLPNDLVIMGEVGLAGEIRPVQWGQERLREAAKHGFRQALIPEANQPKGNSSGVDSLKDMRVYAVKSLSEALQIIF